VIFSNILTFLEAGTDTTGNYTSSAVFCLAKYKDQADRVRKEVNEYFKTTEDISHDSLRKMDVTNAFLKEVMRLEGPAGFILNRNTIKEHKIGNRNIKKGE